MAKRRKAVRYTKKLAEFICDKIESGMSVAQIVRKYGPESGDDFKVPTEKTIYRWRRQHQDFKADYDIAYQTFMYRKIDEMYDIGDAELPTIDEIAKLTGKANPSPAEIGKYINAYQSKQRDKVNILKFVSAKLAPKLVPELSDKVQVDHKVDNQIRVIVPDWGLGPKVIDGELDDKK